jgi:hypothetical protein
VVSGVGSTGATCTCHDAGLMASIHRGARAIVAGGLVAGTLDILDAFAMWIPRGASATRILQSIASGLLGPSAFQGGTATAALGLALHFFIATSAASVYYAASRMMPMLVRRWVVCGFAFGICVYVVMNYVVIPLSLVHPSPFVLRNFINGILIHMFGIGLPIAYFASRSRD